jgi:hypothetical protein
MTCATIPVFLFGMRGDRETLAAGAKERSALRIGREANPMDGVRRRHLLTPHEPLIQAAQRGPRGHVPSKPLITYLVTR